MTWGPFIMYYHCPKCGLKFDYELGALADFGEEFGYCPECRVPGIFEKEGARQPDDDEYLDVE